MLDTSPSATRCRLRTHDRLPGVEPLRRGQRRVHRRAHERRRGAGRGPARRVRHGQPARRVRAQRCCTTGSTAAATSPASRASSASSTCVGDELTTHATRHRHGARSTGCMSSTSRSASRNQNGDETMPGTAQVVLFGDRRPRMPAEPARAGDPDARARRAPRRRRRSRGWAGRSSRCASYPVDANDIRRWAQAVYYPDAPPRDALRRRRRGRTARGASWSRRATSTRSRGIPTYHPEAYPWMRGMGTEPGCRGLNGGQKLVLRADARRRRHHRRRHAHRRVREGRHAWAR